MVSLLGNTVNWEENFRIRELGVVRPHTSNLRIPNSRKIPGSKNHELGDLLYFKIEKNLFKI